METTKQKAELRALVTKLYKDCGCEVEPLFPKVLVRVLPREQEYRGLVLPDGKQNKPVIEGLVLKTYKPFYRRVYLEDVDWVREKPDPKEKYSQLFKCEVEPGDHVLFPHIDYGIVPVWPLDDGEGDYRMVPENLIISKLEYGQQSMQDWLTDTLIDGFEDQERTKGQSSSGILAEFILKRADVVPKNGVTSKTMSGA